MAGRSFAGLPVVTSRELPHATVDPVPASSPNGHPRQTPRQCQASNRERFL